MVNQPKEGSTDYGVPSYERPCTRPKQRRIGTCSVFNFCRSQVSPAYADRLENLAEYWIDDEHEFTGPWSRSKPFIGESKGTDSNFVAQQGRFAAIEYSPRGFGVSGWIVHEQFDDSRISGPREGILKRRSMPAPEDRVYFASLIRECKYEQEHLERRSNRKRTVKMLEDQQLQYYADKLKKEEAEVGAKMETVIERREEKMTQKGKKDHEGPESVEKHREDQWL